MTLIEFEQRVFAVAMASHICSILGVRRFSRDPLRLPKGIPLVPSTQYSDSKRATFFCFSSSSPLPRHFGSGTSPNVSKIPTIT